MCVTFPMVPARAVPKTDAHYRGHPTAALSLLMLGRWKVESGKWKVESGKWKLADWKVEPKGAAAVDAVGIAASAAVASTS